MRDHDNYPRASVVLTEPLVNVQLTGSQFAHLVACLLASETRVRVNTQSVADYISDWMELCTTMGHTPDEIWGVVSEIEKQRRVIEGV